MAVLTLHIDGDRIVEVRTTDGRLLFEIMAGTDTRGDYVQVRGGPQAIAVEPRADNVVRVRERS